MQHFKKQLMGIFVKPVQGAAIGIQQRLGRYQNGFQQLGLIPFFGQRDADAVKLL